MALRTRLTALPRRLREPAAAAVFGGLYLVTAELSSSLGPKDLNLLWIPSGLYLGVLLISDKRRWPLLVCATLLGSLGANLLAGNSPAVSLAFAVPSCAEGMLGALLVLRLAGGRFSLERLRDVSALILGAAIVANGLTALSAAGAAAQAFDVSFGASWLRWWSADALGIVAVTPIVVALGAGPLGRLSREQAARVGPVFAGVAAIVLFLAFAEPLGTATVVAGTVGLPLLLWAGWRLSPRVAALGGLALALAATYLAPRQGDPFDLGVISGTEALIVQGFLATLLTASLAFSATAAERREAGRALTSGRHRLRRLVQTAPDAYISLDEHGRITEWSPAAEATFGWPRADALGLSLHETIVPAAEREAWAAAIERRADSAETGRRAPHLIAAHRTGRTLPAELTIAADSPDETDASHLFIRDVSEGEGVRAELVAAEQQLARRAQELARADEQLEDLGKELGLKGRALDRAEVECRCFKIALGDSEAGREEAEAGRGEAEAGRAEAEGRLARAQEAVAAAEAELHSVQGRLDRAEASREETRERLERALDAMVMNFAHADRERRLLARRATSLVLRYDSRGICRYASPACQELLGFAPGELVGRQGTELLHPEDRARLGHARAADGDTTFAARLLRKDGATVRVEATFSPVRDPATGRLLELEVTVDRSADESKGKGRRRAAEARFEATFGRAPIGMALLTPGGRLCRVNAALCRLTGQPREQLEATGLAALVRPEDSAEMEAGLARVASGELTSLQAELGLLGVDRDVLRAALDLTAVGEAGMPPDEIVAQVQDRGELGGAEEELRRLTDHDPLTGLYSRGRFEEELRDELAAAERYGTRGVVLAVDLDGFTTLNGLLGRSRADELIGSVAYALGRRLRTTDVVGRTGGDQFGVLLPRADAPQAKEVAIALLEAVREAGRGGTGAHPLQLTASIGIAAFGNGRALSAEELLVEAEIAVQDAKHAGGDGTMTYDSSGDGPSEPHDGLGWAEQIRAALEADRFLLHAQPILSLVGDPLPRHQLLPQMVGASGELIPPAAFLPAADRFGVAGEIDRWLLHRAIAALAEETAAGRDVRVEVALSARAPEDPELHAFVAEELRAAGADPRGLCVTIAETSAIRGTDRAGLFLRRLAEVGCEVGLDRFGAGVASFLHVERLPVEYVKLDAALVQRVTAGGSARLIVKAIADIAHGLGRRTMAPSVSDAETLEALRRLGVGYVQGPAVAESRPLAELQLSRS